ncbi:putative Negative regulator of flagellin synthesis flgM [Desulfosarcina cetonica]|uniref:flagellar biosynthesis anti-sigma factor FlgM n=1 Tax=Desulfosarcina cetonica TaxID=90730 RepID=UPI0006D1B452|nr:flagellar biosynthesis anti-sigma factor FlgM [Desulfosarcina cetonica]VTR65247.1 putative Negative regulator of flagellin synthesis flgM [Desulfosarcina cetonica]
MELSAKTQRLTLQINNALFNHARSMTSMDSREATDSEDMVNLSGGGSAIGDAAWPLNDGSETCGDKVAMLKQSIASGNYRVNGKRVAANLLTEAGENNELLKQMGIDA